MKKLICRIIGLVITTMIVFNNFCYADVVVDGAARRSSFDGRSIKMIIGLGILLVVIVAAISIFAVNEEKKKQNEKNDKEEK